MTVETTMYCVLNRILSRMAIRYVIESHGIVKFCNHIATITWIYKKIYMAL
jgi:hypothetical protein